MQKKSAFTLMELLIVMTIAGILASVGISGYMGTLRTQRRQDAVLSLQKAALIISSTTSGNPMCPTATTPTQYQSSGTACLSSSGFYYINYHGSTGLTSIPTIITSTANFLMADENIILQATAVTGKGQDKDFPPTSTIDCRNIYLSNKNKIYPENCAN